MFFNGVSLVFSLFSDCLINFLANEEKLFARTEKSKSFSYFGVYAIWESKKYRSNSNNIRKGKRFIEFEIVEIRLPFYVKIWAFVNHTLLEKLESQTQIRESLRGNEKKEQIKEYGENGMGW